MLNNIVEYMMKEEWEFTLEQACGDPARLTFPILDGRLILCSDGTWSYEED